MKSNKALFTILFFFASFTTLVTAQENQNAREEKAILVSNEVVVSLLNTPVKNEVASITLYGWFTGATVVGDKKSGNAAITKKDQYLFKGTSSNSVLVRSIIKKANSFSNGIA